jgi:hypothetical protein
MILPDTTWTAKKMKKLGMGDTQTARQSHKPLNRNWEGYTDIKVIK